MLSSPFIDADIRLLHLKKKLVFLFLKLKNDLTLYNIKCHKLHPYVDRVFSL